MQKSVEPSNVSASKVKIVSERRRHRRDNSRR
jgi:hypothetical protein